MNKTELNWRSERGHHFYKISETAVRVVTERIMLEDLGLTLKSVPLCTEEESTHIEELIPRAKEGFALALKSERSTKSQDRDILDITTPFTLENIWSRVSLTDRQNTLSEYGHVLASLIVLSQAGRVSFFDFPDPPEGIDYRTGMTQTYWFNSSDSFERVWNNMDELEGLTRKMLYSREPMEKKDILKIGHFFMSGKAISSIFENI